MPAFVALLLIDLHFPDAGSLKAKRKDLKSIKALLHGRLGVTVAEVDHQDIWQRATLTAAIAGRSTQGLQETVDGVERFLDARFPEAGVRVERFVASVEDLRG